MMLKKANRTLYCHVKNDLRCRHLPFDPARDIEGIAVNRWPRGYAPEYNSLIDGDTPPGLMPNVIGRARFGRIAIANSDSGMGAYTDVAINEAHRAVHELRSV